MRDNISLYRGKRKDNGEWVYGSLIKRDLGCFIVDESNNSSLRLCSESVFAFDCVLVIPKTVGQFTGLTEFVMTDKTFNKDLYENDIIEVWSRRRPEDEDVILWRDKPSSVYDTEVKIRGVIKYKNGEWVIDFNNDYNNQICKLKGKESRKRTVLTCDRLYRYGCCLPSDDEEWHREHNKRYKWDDIVKLGNVFDNPELLKGGVDNG